MKQSYGNYVSLTKEPTQDVFDQTVKALRDSIPKEHRVDWETFELIYKTPGQKGSPFSVTDDGEDAFPFWTIAMKYQAEMEEE